MRKLTILFFLLFFISVKAQKQEAILYFKDSTIKKDLQLMQ